MHNRLQNALHFSDHDLINNRKKILVIFFLMHYHKDIFNRHYLEIESWFRQNEY